MSFIIPAIAAGVGAWASGKGKANAANKQNQYQTDQDRRDYEAARALAEEQDQRRMDGVDFLKSVAQGKGYNIPDSAFEALARRGVYKGMSATDRIADRPKQGSSVWGALGTGVTKYGDLMAQAALNESQAASAFAGIPGGGGGGGSFTMDGGMGDMSLTDYYKSLLPDNSEFSVSPSNHSGLALAHGG